MLSYGSRLETGPNIFEARSWQLQVCVMFCRCIAQSSVRRVDDTCDPEKKSIGMMQQMV